MRLVLISALDDKVLVAGYFEENHVFQHAMDLGTIVEEGVSVADPTQNLQVPQVFNSKIPWQENGNLNPKECKERSKMLLAALR